VARKHWEFDLQDGHHVVDLVHAYFLGTRTFVVDGTKTVQRAMPFTDHSGEYPFPLPGHDARLRVTTNGITYSHDLVIDGRSIGTGDSLPGTPARPRMSGLRSQRGVGLFVLVISVPLAVAVSIGAYDEYRYHTASATAVGVVQDKRIINGRYGQTYELSYVFVDLNGSSHAHQGDVPRAAYDQARAGSRSTIQYLPDDPTRSRVLGKDDTLPIAGLMALAIACLVYSVYAIVSGGRRLAAAKRIAEVGQPVTATITKLKRVDIRGVGKTVTIEYLYTDPFGRSRKGRGPFMYPSEGAMYGVGGSVRVLIDPDRPGDSVLP
jgi:hypothetical protein